MIAICLLNVISYFSSIYIPWSMYTCYKIHIMLWVNNGQYSMQLQQLIMTGVSGITHFSYLRPIANELELSSFESNNYSLMPIFVSLAYLPTHVLNDLPTMLCYVAFPYNNSNSYHLYYYTYKYYTYACFQIMLFTCRNIFTPFCVVLFYFQGKRSPLLNIFPLAQAPVFFFFATDLEEVLLILFISLNVILRTHILCM